MASYALQSVLCAGFCQDDCRTYATPVLACYAASALFPDDESWSAYDMWDVVVLVRPDDDDQASIPTLRRSIFVSVNGTCTEPVTDTFDLPLDACIGPFGAPRPWGFLSLFDEEAAATASWN
jgi:hypothetical protein